MILPLIIAVYRDSVIWGNQSYLNDQTKGGHSVKIVNARPEYTSCFDNIDGLTYYYEDGSIYIKMGNFQNRMLLNSILFDEIKDEKLVIQDISHLGTDDSFDRLPYQLLAVNGIFMIVSLFIIQSAYKNHINKFIPDIGTLLSYGAKNRQIKTIFLIEFVIIYFFSAISAVGITSIVMYALFQLFLQVQNVDNLSWLMFNVNPITILAHVLVFFAALIASPSIILWRKMKQPAITLIGSIASGDKIKHYRRKIYIPKTNERKNAVDILAKILSRRTKKHFIGCLMISIPITIVAVFVLNLLFVVIGAMNLEPEYALRVEKESWAGGFSNEELAFISDTQGVARVKKWADIPIGRYIIKNPHMEGPNLITHENESYAQTRIFSYRDNVPDDVKLMGFDSHKSNIAINKNHNYLRYKVGDRILLYPYGVETVSYIELADGTYEEYNSLTEMGEPIELVVTQLLDFAWTDRMFQIFFTDELFDELSGNEPVYMVDIEINDPKKHTDLKSIFEGKFIGYEYKVVDNQGVFLKLKDMSTGLYVMSLFIACIMFALILIILYVKLAGYIETQERNIRIFHMIGASTSDIYDSYLRFSLNISIISIVISFMSGLVLLIVFFSNTGYYPAMNAVTVSTHLIIAMLILTAYNLPIHTTLKKKLKEI
jgi:ABC-type antimicrobial peptide transport system permease subunit